MKLSGEVKEEIICKVLIVQNPSSFYRLGVVLTSDQQKNQNWRLFYALCLEVNWLIKFA